MHFFCFFIAPGWVVNEEYHFLVALEVAPDEMVELLGVASVWHFCGFVVSLLLSFAIPTLSSLLVHFRCL